MTMFWQFCLRGLGELLYSRSVVEHTHEGNEAVAAAELNRTYAEPDIPVEGGE